MSEQEVSARLQASRKSLLDTSRRNRLIHYRPSRASGVEVLGEDAAEAYRLLVIEGRAMTFGATASEKVLPPDQMALYELRASAEAELDAFLESAPAPVANPSDLILSTNEDAVKLDLKLLKILRDARTATEETGVNTLFLALGMLHWQEDLGDRAARRSPLVLIPVHLEPRKNGSYALRYDGGEVGFNLSLAAAMRMEFQVELPEPPDADALDLHQYFEGVREAISRRTDWSVEPNDIALGFFSYAKYLIYADLDEEAWPEEGKPIDHDVLVSLLRDGFEDTDQGYPATGSLDAFRSVGDIHDVIGADSSQTLAVMEAATGRSMVIQGPPGTGKSQTITNLMADALANGKRVLFVAEKMAALEVVARRMAECGLGDACLQLHSQKARKTEFFAELRRVLEVAEPGRVRAEDELNRLEKARLELNAYSTAINAEIGTRGISVRDAMGQLILLGEEEGDRLRVDLPAFAQWSEGAFQGILPLAEALQNRYQTVGCPLANPFYGSRMTTLIALDVPGYLQVAAGAGDNLQDVESKAGALAKAVSVPVPTRLEDIAVVKAAALLLSNPPTLSGVQVRDSRWHRAASQLESLLNALERIQSQTGKLQATVRDEGWRADVTTSRAALAEHGRKWYRFLIGDFRRASRQIDALCQTPGLPPVEKLRVAEAIIDVQNARHVLAESGDLVGLFGSHWRGETSAVSELRRLTVWMTALHGAIGEGRVPATIFDYFDSAPTATSYHAESEELSQAAQRYLDSIREASAALQMSGVPKALIESFASARELLEAWADGQTKLEEIVSTNKLGMELKMAGLNGLADFCLTHPEAGSRAADVLRRSWYDRLVREAFASSMPLQMFDRVRHEEKIAEFRSLDEKLLQINRARIRLQHYGAVPNDRAGGIAGWLLTQTNRKRNLPTIRQAMEKAGSGVQAIKPIFMMSPLSVAMYLPQLANMFDLVIFDEASQVKPEDAFGAVLRGRQVVVVGDSKQMPPTSFFDKITGSDEASEEEDVDLSVANDMESILALMDSRIAAQSPRRRDLRWHYRSRHHSLIEPSNALFYQHRLFLFPNPEPPTGRLGLRYHRIASDYDRGGSRTNRAEAKAVAAAAQEHVRTRPTESLMIVAFSQAQQQAIQDELDLLVRQDPAFVAYAERFPTERLDVKNLENVQGDERDAVLISVGYGRDAQGFLSMSFGPLNAEGGERRLNVLITRARRRCEVFTNLTSEDIRTEAGSKAGLVAFKEFLHYAETGHLGAATLTGREPMSPFEEAVMAALQAKGYEVEAQVGCAGFFIDIGVRDPNQPGRFLLGIECDGAQYHHSRTARDRDKLRQAVLEDRGWTIHRIWSTDWFGNPKQVLTRVEAAIESAARGGPSVPDEPETAPIIDVEELGPDAPLAYVVAKVQLEGGRPTRGAIRSVLEQEGPIHIDELMRRLREAAGMPKLTNEFRAAIRHLVTEDGQIITMGEFLCLEGQEIVVRDRSSVAAARKMDLVSDWEIETAVSQVVRESLGIESGELTDLVAQRLGFGRVSDSALARLGMVVEQMIRDGKLHKDGNTLQVR